MYICNECGAHFDEPHERTFCLEDDFGVGSMFHDKHYGTMNVCPYCESNDFRYVEDDDEFDE